MDKKTAFFYYSREDVQKALLSFAKDREVAVRFDTYFGKRPDMVEYLSDVKAFVKKGATSFHISEERWTNPLLLGEKNLSREDLDANRSGWDLILDLDGVDFEYSKIVGDIIIKFLFELGVKNVSLKFSGNKGFHIGVPFEAFSANIIGIGETRKLFPDVARRIAAYLTYELKGEISKAILEFGGGLEAIAKKYGFEVSELVIDDPISLNFDFMKIMEIDTILIASRHLFRMPYSLNEKSGLVSVPVRCEDIMKFQKSWGFANNVKPEFNRKFEFLKYDAQYGKDADILLIKAYEEDFLEKVSDVTHKNMQSNARSTEFKFEIVGDVDIKDFPKSIVYLLNVSLEDGKKRALFVLLTFLYGIRYSAEIIEKMVDEWNQKQVTPLKDNYIKAQYNWFKNQSKTISTPNFESEEYYKQIGVPLEIIAEDRKKFKVNARNPLHYIYLLMQVKQKVGGSKKEINKSKNDKKEEN